MRKPYIHTADEYIINDQGNSGANQGDIGPGQGPV